ncbi:MAG: hypothetical protein KGI69_02375 [Patescibacteria group bacterium]|nr:hypothetical protein [Patescibacteria group bacterium]
MNKLSFGLQYSIFEPRCKGDNRLFYFIVERGLSYNLSDVSNDMIIKVISSLADDVIFHEGQKGEVREGGPAFWISDALRHRGQDFELITGEQRSEVEIMVRDGEEIGKIVSVSPIEINGRLDADAFIISTISDEFNIQNIESLDGLVAVDLQGYVRAAKSDDRKLVIDQRLASLIGIAKLTRDEASHVIGLDLLKDKILLITDGEKGFDLYANGALHHFDGEPIRAKDTIGAGDTLFARFVVEYMRSHDILESARRARGYVADFLRSKR